MTMHNTSTFTHDGAPCHRSKVVSEYLTKSKMTVLDWPGSRLYLNLTKNLWSYLKNKVAEKQPPSATELVTAMKEVWVNEIGREYHATLVKIMPTLLVIEVRVKNGQK